MLAAVAYNSVAHSVCEIQMGQKIHNPQPVDLMLESRITFLLHHVGQDVLSYVAERSVPKIMAHSDCPGKLVIQPHGPADSRGD